LNLAFYGLVSFLSNLTAVSRENSKTHFIFWEANNSQRKVNLIFLLQIRINSFILENSIIKGQFFRIVTKISEQKIARIRGFLIRKRG